ncbi:tRNA-(ms[2]io[6]A)-hydroxylase [Aquimarina sp. AD10]|uniref:tRNA hydroxylase n=1 Tax=Aquimarina aggregata TaxID=1642818 RepID=A0A163CB97_9FLAO|nr:MULTISPECIES: tRNA-(ms[2]io[6]A)-hydroxylase [Aquimarina]AXT59771.1 tRNA-(ms[2]io[6]A)-hydroxylase [Aquimarina sp. AD10]KZS42242.1 tRNA hydroxylase [Aquimarina aggregata]RKM97641.1 tRNA-(ms[2]io[6]A)-hydroxylase [Aquimarina sp. AD10]
MLGLKLATDPRWAKIAESNIEEILTDHAWCEQKAATNAITIITMNSEHTDLVTDLIVLAQEELQHFQMVHNIIKERGYTLGRERKDSYVNELFKYKVSGGDGSRVQGLVRRLLFSAMIEARSCERFKLLSEKIKDPELSKFYHELMISEAGHYTTFIGFARKYGKDVDVDKQWEDLLQFEGELIQRYGTSETIHG